MGLLVPALGPRKQLVQRLGWTENGTDCPARAPLGTKSGVTCFCVVQGFKNGTCLKGLSMPSSKRAQSGCLRATLALPAGGHSPKVMCLWSLEELGSGLKVLSSWLMLSDSVIIMDPSLKCFREYKRN